MRGSGASLPAMVMNGTNLEHASAYNRRLVLEAVRSQGPISRAELARLTGLSAQTVSNIAEEFAALGLLQARRRRRASRGQPPVDLAINPRGGYTIGLHLNSGGLVAVLVDLAGAVVRRRRWKLSRFTAQTLLPRLAAAVAALADGERGVRGRVLGVGLAMPGPFDVAPARRDGPPAHAVAWDDLRARLGEAIALPVLMENDATAAALGERLYGVGRSLRQFFLVYVGAGLGGGLIIDGVPYKGAGGNAGEFGHIVVEPGGAACSCGNRGCLERYFSLDAARAALGTDDPATLDARLAAGDAALARWLDAAAARLATALVTVENLLDPETILIGGEASPALIDAIIVRLAAMPPSVSARPGRSVKRVLRATAGPAAGALGAAALPIFDMLRPSFRPMLAAPFAGRLRAAVG